MKTFKTILFLVLLLNYISLSIAQVPSYVPTNGLKGWWPFNGNANDDSGNGNHGIINGATLTLDRFGNNNSAFSFDGLNDYISVNNSPFTNGPFTISAWVKYSEQIDIQPIISLGELGSNSLKKLYFIPNYYGNGRPGIGTAGANDITSNSTITTIDIWYHLAVVFNSYSVNGVQFYLNGLPLSNNTTTGVNIPFPLNNSGFTFGKHTGTNSTINYVDGIIDDIGIWNRALSQTEILALYNACSNPLIINQPLSAVSNINSFAQFSINTVTGSNIQWQTDPLHLGWQNITNNNFYYGSNTNYLSVINTSVSNHNQNFRAIVNIDGCKDTSNIVTLSISDTCIISVTDTLIINAILSGLNPPLNINTLKIYPNPSSTHIIIDYGIYYLMTGYNLRIINALGQTMFYAPINQQSSYIDLSTWTGNGLYFVQIINPQNVIIENRKIVIQ